MTNPVGRVAVVVAVAANLSGCSRAALTAGARQEAHSGATTSALTGGWELLLVLDSAALDEKRALARELAAGTLTFTESAMLRAGLLRRDMGQVRHELGVAAIDLSPMLGEGYRPGELTRWLKSIGGEFDGSMEKEVLATTFSGDSVEIESPPAIDHFGIMLNGRIRGDSITGRWFQKKFCCGASGRFVLRRRQ